MIIILFKNNFFISSKWEIKTIYFNKSINDFQKKFISFFKKKNCNKNYFKKFKKQFLKKERIVFNISKENEELFINMKKLFLDNNLIYKIKKNNNKR